ncbi:MAG: pyridoxine 5'-phosphate synthase [Spirochaetia bacterium]|nr:pyridoxine 5'-phosphate synthase [Spirochaetia bacterium]
MHRLSVNLDHIATLRQLRHTTYPDLLEAARIAEQAGAEGITLHLRADRRHIQLTDVELIRAFNLPLTLEIACSQANLELCLRLKPHAVTFVPETKEELTTEGGLNMNAASVKDFLKSAVLSLKDAGVNCCLFLEPDTQAIEQAHELGIRVIELHTGTYADAKGAKIQIEQERILHASALGRSLGIQMNAGHGLTVANVTPFAADSNLVEFSIGHSIVCRAVLVGLAEAVREMKQAIG